MICVDQETGTRMKEPLRSLCTMKGAKVGKNCLVLVMVFM